MRSKNIGVLVLAALLLFLLAACGGSDNDSDGTDNTDSGTDYETGVFLDSPVINIGYRTETLEGVTNSLGEYDYVAGETVTFFIGELEFPTVAATGTVTPLDLAGTDDTQDKVVVNILRLLQTLDQDGNPDNGITITDAAKAAATAVDFEMETGEFEADADVLDLIANGGQDSPVTELISEGEAVSNFEEALFENGIGFVSNPMITGTWTQSAPETDSDLVAFTFFEDGTYMFFEIGGEEAESGMEWGIYTWDSETDLFRITPEFFDGNGEAGTLWAPAYVAVSGDTLTLYGSDDDENGDGVVDENDNLVFSRAASGGIAGTWVCTDCGDSNKSIVGFVFFDDDTYIHFEVGESDGEGASGMEWGSYAWDSDTGALTATQAYDDNGDWGLSDADDGSGLYVDVADDVLTFECDETHVFDRHNDFSSRAGMAGTWAQSAPETDNDLVVFTFFEDGTYMFFEVDEEAPYADESGESGMEWGVYAWNSETELLYITPELFDGNGETGTLWAPAYAEVSGDTLTLYGGDDDENGDGVVDENDNLVFTRAASDGIAGTWVCTDCFESDENILGVTFFDDDTYLQFEVEESQSDETGASGMEWGSYTWDSDTGAMSASQTYDDNGDWGLSDADDGSGLYMDVAGDVLTFECDETHLFERQTSF